MRVVVEPDALAVDRALFGEFASFIAHCAQGLVSLATGATYAGFFARVTAAVEAGEIDLAELRITHLDEFSGFDPDHRGGMVHELCTACPPLRAILEQRRLIPVPARSDATTLHAHEQQVRDVDLQFLGLGRNGHIGFNEPGTPFHLGFHRIQLTTATRADAMRRFAPSMPPHDAITSGPRTILAARRIVLAATGATKAPAVRAMLEGPVDPSCPASCIRRHRNAVVYLDVDAASLISIEQQTRTNDQTRK